MGPLSKLLKIQELEIILKESAIVHDIDTINTAQIQETIKTLREEVPDAMLQKFARTKKNGMGITQELKGRCKACHMSIPVGTLNRIQNANQESTCPNCNVYIFLESFTQEN